MGLMDFFKKKVNSERSSDGSCFDTNVDAAELKILINTAISIFQDNPDSEPDQIIDQINVYVKDDRLSIALYRFIPVAYCRLFIPDIEYPDEFVLFKSEHDQQTFSFSADKIYKAVQQQSKMRYTMEPFQEKIVPILFHSSEFDAINNALNDGAELKHLVLSPPVFL